MFEQTERLIRQCVTCGDLKPLDDFYFCEQDNCYRRKCKSCYNENDRQKKALRKLKLIELEKHDWQYLESKKGLVYSCNFCTEKNIMAHMVLDNKNKRVTPLCKSCKKKKQEDWKAKNAAVIWDKSKELTQQNGN